MLRIPKASSKVDVEDEIYFLQFELLEETQDNKLLMEDFLSSLQNINGKQKTLNVI
jgi:hypothetical protein